MLHGRRYVLWKQKQTECLSGNHHAGLDEKASGNAEAHYADPHMHDEIGNEGGE